MSSHPSFVLVAGPNGAGKSTAAPALLRDEFEALEFVNADDIAKGLSAFHPEKVAVAAGKILIRRFQDLMESGESFAIETTLSGRGYTRHIANLKRRGYRFELIFLWLPSENLAIARVAQRVVLGGHNIPEPVIRRRYKAGLSNFFSLYRPLADSWRFYDCSSSRPRFIAYGKPNRRTRPRHQTLAYCERELHMKLHEKLQNNAWVTAAIQRGTRDALIKHKAMGVAIAVWRDGETVLVPPEEIVIPELIDDNDVPISIPLENISAERQAADSPRGVEPK